MKLHNENTLQTDGVDQKDVRAFTIKANGKAFQILIAGLYSQKIDSVVREICSNAYDSHISAGCPSKPYDITLPTSLEPVFTVRDFGIGLSAEQAKFLFTTIFESTKENSSSDIGAFGLGSKSPYAITDQFIIESRFEGIHSKFLAFKDETGVPSLLTTSETETTEENGVTISIPVKPSEIWAVQAAVKRQLYFFPVKPTISGSENPGFWHKTNFQTLIGSKTYLEKTSAWQGHRVKMGPVSYPLDLNELESNVAEKLRTFDLQDSLTISDLPMGSLDLQPSREGLSYIPQTKAALNEYFADMLAEYDDKIFDEWKDNQDNLLQAIDWVTKMNTEQPYSRTMDFATDKFFDGKMTSISEIVKQHKFTNIVKFEAITQTESRQALTIDVLTGIETMATQTFPVVRMPFSTQKLSTYSKTVKKTFEPIHSLGLDMVRAIIAGHTVVMYVDETQKASNRARYFIEQNGNKHLLMLLPNPHFTDTVAKSAQAFADLIGNVNGDANGIFNNILIASEMDLPPVEVKFKFKKEANDLGSVYLVGRNYLNATRIWKLNDLPKNAPFIVTERGQVASAEFRKTIQKCATEMKIVSVSKSATGDIKKLIAAGHPTLEAWIDEKSESWKAPTFIANTFDKVKDSGKIISVPELFSNMKAPVFVEFKEKLSRVRKIASKCKSKIDGKDYFFELYHHFNDKPTVMCVARGSVRSKVFVKELNDLKRISKKMSGHPLMLMARNMDHYSTQYMEPEDKRKVLKFVEENFNI